MEYLTLGELLSELDCYDDEEILNVELTGEWGVIVGTMTKCLSVTEERVGIILLQKS